MQQKAPNINSNKNVPSINSSLASIHLKDEFFISSPIIGIEKMTLIVKSRNRNQSFTPIFPKSQICSTVVINCEYNSPSQRSNSVKLDKSNMSIKNISNKNLICEPFTNLKNELNDIDNADINKGSVRKLKTINFKKAKKNKEKKSVTELKKKNNKLKIKYNK